MTPEGEFLFLGEREKSSAIILSVVVLVAEKKVAAAMFAKSSDGTTPICLMSKEIAFTLPFVFKCDSFFFLQLNLTVLCCLVFFFFMSFWSPQLSLAILSLCFGTGNSFHQSQRMQ